MATSGSKSVTVTSWDTLKFSWSATSQSVANNTTTVSWSLQLIAGSSGRISSTTSKAWSVTVNGTKYSGTNTVGIANNATKTLASGTTTIAHNSDGTKTFSYSFSQSFSGITFSGTALGTVSGSGSGTLNTIPRKSTLSASNGTLGNAQTLTVTRKSTSFTHTITYKCGSATGTIATKSSSTSISWTPPLSLAQQNTTGTSVSVTLTITTYSGSTNVGSNALTISCGIPASVVPTVSISVSDASGYASTYGKYVQGQSKIKVVVTASGAQGSTIKSYSTTADGKTYTAASFTTSAIAGSGTLTIKATVKDSRGRTATASKSITVWAYSTPKISEISVNRCNADGSANNAGGYIAIKFDATATSMDSVNTVSYVAQYKKTSESSYTTITLTDYANQYSVTDGVFVFAADTASSYDIKLTITDSFTSASKTAVGSSAKKLWSILKKGLGIAIGKIAELENVFEIAFQTKFTGGILHPVLEPETDLNDILTPNTYVGANLSTYNYANCPLDSGTFTLEVVGMGESGQVKQRVTSCRKTDARAFERIYYTSAWGEWVCVSDYSGTLLWSGNYYMTADHVANLSEPISKQRSGVVLVFARYVAGEEPYAWSSFFVPKYAVAGYNSSGHSFIMAHNSFTVVATKYLYIRDKSITGNENNNRAGTANGITFDNAAFTLKYVIGV